MTGPNAPCNRQNNQISEEKSRSDQNQEPTFVEYKRKREEDDKAPPKEKYAKYMESSQAIQNPLALGMKFGNTEGKVRDSDWFCSFCSFKNFQKRKICKKCKKAKQLAAP